MVYVIHASIRRGVTNHWLESSACKEKRQNCFANSIKTQEFYKTTSVERIVGICIDRGLYIIYSRSDLGI